MSGGGQMRPIKPTQVVLIVGLSLLTLVGCSTNKSPGEKAFQYMEKAAQLESVFNAQQKPLIQEEQKEQQLYQEILALDMKHFDQIKEKSKQALKSVAVRKRLLEKEKESMDQAAIEFKKAEPYIKKIKNTNQATIGNKAIKDMHNRYAAFNKLNTYYNDSLKSDESLFKLLETKELTVETLQEKLDQVNASYKKIDQEKNQFNHFTKEFNIDKKAFYKSMNISGEHSG
jgi:hypothetical protein